MKKRYRYCAGPAYYRMCSTDVYRSNKPAAVAPKETITHHFFCFWNCSVKKTVDAAKICGGAENKHVKTETPAHSNGLLGFITLGIYTPKRVWLLTIIA